MTARKRSETLLIPEKDSGRVWIENVKPRIDGGRFPAKRTVGETVRVVSDVFTDGHDALSVVLCHRPASAEAWAETPMRFIGNDTYVAEFFIAALEPHLFTVKAWIDRFSTWKDGLRKKFEAAQDVSSELLEGAQLLDQAAERAAGADRRWLTDRAASLRSDAPQADRVARALSEDLAAIMARYPDRSREAAFERILPVKVDRERARFSAWYELFPRSASPDPGRSGTFKDVEGMLPYLAGMGFDVLYFPPIHPIGRVNRKGPNNTLNAGPEDPGSPWAIGSAEGGHKAIHPELGTFEDFAHLVQEARRFGLEVALDLAYQCAPDHPYVTEHPEWFLHRPDGTIKYAENPPKQYQDVYPFNFECDNWEELWDELKSVVTFWIEKGVRIFRVDNPHTKPLRFWHWLIAEIHAQHPDVIFLSEAFTRPKVMNALAKVGFNQSYTYFTWRNTKREITEYLTELTQTELREYFRPNFFTNTPDILPEYLQFGGRPAFLVRLVLAATLSASYGIYCGFELCEARAVPGTEEYLDSEKYQVRHWDWDRPGNLRDFIRRINTIRRENPALHSNEGLRFYDSENDHLIFFGKTTRDLSNIILVVVNVDPFQTREGWVHVPLEDLGIAPDEVFQVHDLIGEGRYFWQGSRNFVRLNPAASPAQIFRIRRRLKREHDFDYFM
ncbi:MAG: alpha-1,4-glucan--maltose-1-phosphate maltosyltransferase [Thermodesulfobacteriota bacterium]|nr:alpha-1,4-glucan--maltose-1-phosphate maltosyltransferase [Thermodesulfobacteriota bacterium]